MTCDSLDVLLYLFGILESGMYNNEIEYNVSILEKMFISLLHSAMCGNHIDDVYNENIFLKCVLHKLKNNIWNINYNSLKKSPGVERLLLREQNGCREEKTQRIHECKIMALMDCYYECTNTKKIKNII